MKDFFEKFAGPIGSALALAALAFWWRSGILMAEQAKEITSTTAAIVELKAQIRECYTSTRASKDYEAVDEDLEEVARNARKQNNTLWDKASEWSDRHDARLDALSERTAALEERARCTRSGG